MKTYCIVCKNDTVFKTKNGSLILKSTCSVCNNKKNIKQNIKNEKLLFRM